MSEPLRVTVTGDDDETTTRVHDDEGTVDAGDATFSFSVDDGTDDREGPATDDDDPARIVALEAVPSDSTIRCEALSGGRGTEFILYRQGDAVTAWRNSCPHEPEVPLDPGTGARFSRGEIVCHKHGARFEQDQGVCTAGPCAGDALDAVGVEVRDDAVYLADDRYDRAHRL